MFAFLIFIVYMSVCVCIDDCELSAVHSLLRIAWSGKKKILAHDEL